jgi:hypothetical protein
MTVTDYDIYPHPTERWEDTPDGKYHKDLEAGGWDRNFDECNDYDKYRWECTMKHFPHLRNGPEDKVYEEKDFHTKKDYNLYFNMVKSWRQYYLKTEVVFI